jgi:hypothetical protein
MSKQQLIEIANADTPMGVNVPPTWSALAMWAVGRWGGGIVIAGIMLVAANRVYEDLSTLNRTVLTAFQENSKIQAQQAIAINALTGAVEQLTREANFSHRTIPSQR